MRTEIVNQRFDMERSLYGSQDIFVKNCIFDGPADGESEYFMMRACYLRFQNVRMKGKYSFQYITNSTFENCVFDTKDAFWHAKNVVVKDCIVKGEYLAWYSKNVTFQNCKIIGTQPLCYCKELKLIDCEMIDTDLAFERSEVEASITAPMLSVKNPLKGHIYLPEVGEVIRDMDEAKGEVFIFGTNCVRKDKTIEQMAGWEHRPAEMQIVQVKRIKLLRRRR